MKLKKYPLRIVCAFSLICLFLFCAPFLISTWQKQLAYSFLKSLGGDWEVAQIEEHPGSLVFHQPRWTLAHPNQHGESLKASAEKITIDYSILWTAWKVFLKLEAEQLNIVHTDSQQPLHKLFPSSKQPSFLLRPEISLTVHQGSLKLAPDETVQFGIEADYAEDWNASVKILGEQASQQNYSELRIQRNHTGVKELTLICRKCSIVTLEELGREIGLWWDSSFSHSGALDGHFYMMWDRKGPLDAKGSLDLSDFAFTVPWKEEKVIFPHLNFDIHPTQTEDGFHVKADVKGIPGAQFQFEWTDDILCADISEAKASEWAFFQPFILKALNLAPKHAVVLETGTWNAHFEQQTFSSEKRPPFQLSLDLKEGTLIFPDLHVVLEQVGVNLNTHGHFGEPVFSLLGDGILHWRSANGPGLQVLGPLKNGHLKLRKEPQNLIALEMNVAGEDWALQGGYENMNSTLPGQFAYTVAPQFFNKVLPDSFSSLFPVETSQGTIKVTSTPTECLMEAALELPLQHSGVASHLVTGHLNWIYVADSHLEPSKKPKLGSWHLDRNQFVLPLAALDNSFKASFFSLPLEVNADGEILASWSNLGWCLNYHMRDVRIDHPLFALHVPQVAAQAVSECHHNFISLPLKNATMLVKGLGIAFNDLDAEVIGNSNEWCLKEFEMSCCSVLMGGQAVFHPARGSSPARLKLEVSNLLGDLGEIRTALEQRAGLLRWLPVDLCGQIHSDKKGFTAEIDFLAGVPVISQLNFNASLENGSWKSHDWQLHGLSSDLAYQSDAQKIALHNLQAIFSHEDLSHSVGVIADVLEIPLAEGSNGQVELSLLSQECSAQYQFKGSSALLDQHLEIHLQPLSADGFLTLGLDKQGVHSLSARLAMDVALADIVALFSQPHLIRKRFERRFSLKAFAHYDRTSDLLEMQLFDPLPLKLSRRGDVWKLYEATYQSYALSAEWIKHKHTLKLVYGEIYSPNKLHLIGSGGLEFSSKHLDFAIQRLVVHPFALDRHVQHALTTLFPAQFLQKYELNFTGKANATFRGKESQAVFHLSNPSQMLSGELFWRPHADQDKFQAKGLATLEPNSPWQWDAFHNAEDELVHLRLSPIKEKRSLDIAFAQFKDSQWKIASLKGRLPPFELDLHALLDSSDSHAWQGEIKLIGKPDHSLLPESWRQLVHALSIGKGWVISGEWGPQGFSGSINGRGCQICGQRAAVCHAKVVQSFPELLFKQIYLNDGASNIEIENMRLISNHKGSWKVEIPHLLAKKLRFKTLASFSPLFQQFSQTGLFKLLELHQIEGVLGDYESWKACGKCNFQLSGSSFFRQTLLQPALLPGLSTSWESSLLIPVSGNIEFEIHTGKLFLRELKEVYSQGKLSKFSLAPNRLPSFFSAQGDVALFVKVKREGLLRKTSETLFVDVEGHLDAPSFSVRRQAQEDLPHDN